MTESKKSTESDFSKIDAYVNTVADYEEIPELTDEQLARAVLREGGERQIDRRPLRLNTGDLPALGSPAFRSLVELEKHISWTTVVLYRLEERPTPSIESSMMEKQGFDTLQAMDDHALIMHLDRVWRWYSKVRKAGLLDRKSGALLRLLSTQIIFLRNKRQHSEQYLDPMQAKENYTAETYKNMTWYTSPDWSTTINGVRTIGGRLKIHDVGPAVEELHHQLTDAGLWILELTPSELSRMA